MGQDPRPNAIQKLSVILPCFNETENLARLETELFPVLDRQPFKSECVIVDDGSLDSTFSTARALAAGRPDVHVFRHDANRGLGAALRTGFSHATGDAILTLDSDLTFHPSQIPALVAAFADDVDCVMGSPSGGGFERVPIFRRILSEGLNGIYALLLSVPVHSTSSIFRLYRSSSLRRLSLHSRGFDINAEILFKLISSGGRVVEVPVRMSTRVLGTSHIRMGREIMNHLRMFVSILRWRFRASFATDRGRS